LPNAVGRTAKIIDKDFRAASREFQRMGSTQSTPSAGHNHDFIFKFAHHFPSQTNQELRQNAELKTMARDEWWGAG
jgi:hypothetical protein